MFKKIEKILNYTLLKSSYRTPPSLILFVTSTCNSRCKHCFYWQNLNKKDDLSFLEIKKLSNDLGNIDSLNISGGEPFLRNDLPEIINLFYKNNNTRVVTIPTNGLLPLKIIETTRKILKFAEGKQVVLTFSIDGTEKIHDELRGVKGSFQKVLESYEGMQKIKKEFPNLKIQVNTVITNTNSDDIKKLIADLKKLMPDLDLATLSFLRGNPRDKTFHLPNQEKLLELEKFRNQNNPQSVPLTKFIDETIFKLKLKVLKLNRQVVPCEAGRLIGVVSANGDVRHCELLPPVGNVRNKSFPEIWNSEKSLKARQKIVDKCCRCTHECFLFPSLVGHPLVGLKEAWF